MSYKPQQDFRIKNAIQFVLDTYGDAISVDAKKKNLIKFGRNDNVSNTQFELVWQHGQPTELLPTTNSITHISASNAGDTQDVWVEGHTISGTELTFAGQTVTLNGQTKVALTTAIARSSRLKNVGTTGFLGDVYVFEDDTLTSGVPDTITKVHLKAGVFDNQSLKCATSVSKDDYWLVSKVVGGANRNTGTRNIDFKLQTRPLGGIFTTIYPFTSGTNSGSTSVDFEQLIVIPKNHDVRVMAQSSGATTIANAAIHGYLASVIT